jgi:stage IV sporulation protein FB
LFSWHDRHLRIRTRHLPPISLHWSALIGALFFGRASVGGVIGFIALVLVHEIGHAVLVRARGLRAIEIVVHAFGGGCHYEPGWGVPFDHAIIAWGGVVAQALLLAISLSVGRLFTPGPGIFSDILFVFIVPNALMIVLNLLPIQGLDGKLAWELPAMLVERARSGRRRRKLEVNHEKLRRELADIERRRNMH